ncbi:hypothetical protein ACXIUS_24055 [Bosea thiooxidans]|nr:hypothetical protein [Bosea sp. (in: a-proteobacteria)]
MSKTALAAVLNSLARSEVEALKLSTSASGWLTARVAMHDWRTAALGAKPDLIPDGDLDGRHRRRHASADCTALETPEP